MSTINKSQTRSAKLVHARMRSRSRLPVSPETYHKIALDSDRSTQVRVVHIQYIFNMNASFISPNTMPDHSATSRRDSNNSFVDIYDAIEDDFFLELARDVFDDDDDDENTSVNGSNHSASVSGFDDDLVENHPEGARKAVTFGFVTVCEFEPQVATILTSKSRTEAARNKMPLSLYECRKLLWKPLIKHNNTNRKGTLHFSKQQIGHLQIPSIDECNSFRPSKLADSQPRYPRRSLDDRVVKLSDERIEI